MKTIPFLSLVHQHHQIKEAVQESLMKVYDRSSFIMGSELSSFEAEYARFLDVGYCIGVGNGLDALTLALRACGVSKGDEVIVPAHTFIATWLAVSSVGGTVVPVEPDETLNIDNTKLESAVTNRTKVILPVHLYGQPCDMEAIMSLASKHNLLVVEDNAQAHGSKWNQQSTGSLGIANAHSFYPVKNLGALGDGGAITTSDADYAERLKKLRNYGFREKNVAAFRGVNSRLDEMQAAVLRIKLQHLEKWTHERRKVAALYSERLADVGDLILPVTRTPAYHVYHLYVIRTMSRAPLQKFLTDHGVETMIHYPVPPHLQEAYSDLKFRKGSFPFTEALGDTLLSLPLWPGMNEDAVDYITDLIRKFFKR